MSIRASPRYAGRAHLVASQPVPGPIQEADLSQGYFAAAWQLWVDNFGNAHQSILPNPNPLIDNPPTYTTDVPWNVIRRPGIVADQNGRRVVAWQSPTGGVTVSYIETGVPEFERRVVIPNAFDPVLVWDGWMLETGGLTDVILFYLDADHQTLKWRKQSDLYVNANTLLTLAEPGTLDGFKIVGRELCLGGQYELSATQWETRTDLYPMYSTDKAVVRGRHKGGSLNEQIVVRDPYSGEAALQARHKAGTFFEQVVVRDPYAEAVLLQPRHSRGSYRLQGQEFDAINEDLLMRPRHSKGNYTLVFVSSGDIIAPQANLDARHKGGLLDERVVLRDPDASAIGMDARHKSGAFREVGQFFDPASDAIYTTARHSVGAAIQRVVDPRSSEDATTFGGRHRSGTYFEAYRQRDDTNENASFGGRHKGGTLGDSERVTYQLESSILNARHSSGTLTQQNLAPARDAVNDTSMFSARHSGGSYALAPSSWWITTPQTPFIGQTSDEEWMYVWGDWL